MSGSNGESLIALLSGPDRAGIVAKISGWIFEHGGNIIHADQHRDQEEEIFFQRIEWSQSGNRFSETAKEFRTFADSLGMSATVAHSNRRPKFAIMVSKFDHCFHDLILRWKAGDLRGEIVCIVSNHEKLAAASEAYGLPFYHLPINPENKQEVEQRQLEIFQKHGEILDNGPIIQQDVIRVTHRHNIRDLIRKGRDLEKMVLSQAVSWHLENRVLIYGRKTVVFD